MPRTDFTIIKIKRREKLKIILFSYEAQGRIDLS